MCGGGGGFNSVSCVSLGRRRDGREGHVPKEAEIRAMHLRDHTHLGITGDTRSWKRQGGTVPYRFQQERSPADTWALDF